MTLFFFGCFVGAALVSIALFVRHEERRRQRDIDEHDAVARIIRDASAEHECAVIDPARGTVRVLRWSGPGLTQGFGGRA